MHAPISSGAPISIERDNDKNPVVALREIADQTVSPEDLKEDLIHSLQAHVEVDEPEAEAAPALPSARPVNVLGPDDQFSDAIIDRITEEELLQGLARSIPGRIRKQPLEGLMRFRSARNGRLLTGEGAPSRVRRQRGMADNRCKPRR